MRKTLIATGLALAIASCSLGNYIHHRKDWDDMVYCLGRLKHRFVQSIAEGYIESTVFAPSSAATREYDLVPEVRHFFGNTQAYMADKNEDGHDDIVLTFGKSELVFLRIPGRDPANYYGYVWDKSLISCYNSSGTPVSFHRPTKNNYSLDDALLDEHHHTLDGQ